MQQRKIIEKRDGSIYISPHLELLEFLSDDQQGGQATAGFVYNHNMERLDFVKFYGLRTFSETEDRVAISIPNNHFWRRARDRERRVLTPIGQAMYPSVPIPHEIGEWEDVLYMTMSFSQESSSRDNRVTLEDFERGKILTLQQILSAPTDSSKGEMIEQYRHADYQTKLRHFLSLTQIVRRLHDEFNVVHNDIKPSQVLLIAHDNAPPTVQLVDYGMHLDLAGPNDHELLAAPTTLVYNTPQLLAMAAGRGDIARFCPSPDDPELLKRRDRFSLGLLGMQYVLGSNHPYFSRAKSRIRSSKKDLSELDIDERIHLQAQACLEAQEDFFLARQENAFALRDVTRGIPARLESLLHNMVVPEPTQGSLEEDVYRLSEYAKPLWSRRSFLIAVGAVTATAAAASFGISKGLHYLDSPEFLRKELLEQLDRGQLSSTDLEHFVKRSYQEHIKPALIRAVASHESGNMSFPRVVEDGAYQLANMEFLTAGYFARMLRLGCLLGADHALQESYEDVIDHLTKMSPGVGYRSFRIVDPLIEATESSGSGLLSSAVDRKARDALLQVAEHIDKHYIPQGSFFAINPKRKPEVDRFEFEISSDSFFLIKHYSLLDHSKYAAHLDRVITVLNNGGLYPPQVFFNLDPDQSMIFDPQGEYRLGENISFSAYALHQMQMLDVLADAVLLGEQGAKPAWQEAERLVVHNVQERSDPAYIFSEAIRAEGRNAQVRNALPLALRLNTQLHHPELYDDSAVDVSLRALLSAMSFEGEGLLHQTRLSPNYSESAWLMGDYLALRGLYEKSKSKENS